MGRRLLALLVLVMVLLLAMASDEEGASWWSGRRAASPTPPPAPPAGPPLAVWELEARMRVLRLPSAVAVGAELVLHCVGVKQAARLLSIDGAGEAKLRPHAIGEAGAQEATLRFRFVHAAEYVRLGALCVFRDSSAGAANLGLGVGRVHALE